MMCYDYHGKWDNKTGHNAPLHPRPTEPEEEQKKNIEFSLQYLLNKGALPEKTVLGVPFYGRTFTLKNIDSNKMDAPTEATAFQVTYVVDHAMNHFM